MSTPAESKPDLHATLVAPVDPLVGTTIDGRYLIESRLGEGGMGLVYRARHVVLNKVLAVKVLRGEVSDNPQVIARFRQEAQSASAIGNQHIIDVSDFGTLADGSTYFVMEFLDGSPLTRVIMRESPIAIGRLVRIAIQLCDALGAAHGAGIVHRDLKPDNIFLVRRGHDHDFVKVLDFGIAKVGGNPSKITQAGAVFGTPHYMSPEQCGGQEVDGRSDIYALGLILYELLTGVLPFEADTMMGLLTAHLIEPPPPPTTKRPDCPPALEAILLRCLEKRPDARYADCAALAADLEAFVAGHAISLPPRVSGVVESSGSTAPGTIRAPALAQNPGGPRSLLIGVIAAFAIAGLASGALALVLLSRSHAPVAPPPVVVLPAIPPAAAPPATPAPPAAAPTRVTIAIESEPSAAEVLAGGELLGVTPLEIPRPMDGNRLDLVLHADGYEPHPFTVSSSTLGGSLRFTLRRTSGSNRPARSSTPPRRTTETVSAEPTSDPIPRRRPSTEVINPWAN